MKRFVLVIVTATLLGSCFTGCSFAANPRALGHFILPTDLQNAGAACVTALVHRDHGQRDVRGFSSFGYTLSATVSVPRSAGLKGIRRSAETAYVPFVQLSALDHGDPGSAWRACMRSKGMAVIGLHAATSMAPPPVDAHMRISKPN